jgi:hypothetical protein
LSDSRKNGTGRKSSKTFEVGGAAMGECVWAWHVPTTDLVLMPREPRSGYSQEAVPTNSYYGQPVTGVIGRHLPKEIVRIDRDWSDGEVCQ